MQALRKVASEPGLSLEEVAEPRPTATDVVVEVEAASVCGTDLHIISGTAGPPGASGRRVTLGHEFAGTVVEAGADVRTSPSATSCPPRATSHAARCSGLPHRQRAHVRAHGDPRRRPRRRVRPLRRRARVGHLEDGPREAAARDRDAAGAVRQRRLRDERAGPVRPLGGRARLRTGRALYGRHRKGVGRLADHRLRPAPVPARAGADDGRRRLTSTRSQPIDHQGVDVVFEMSGAPQAIARRHPHRAQRRPRDPLRHPVSTRRDGRRDRDLQEPHGAGGLRAGASSPRGTGRAGCSRAAPSTSGR